LQWTDNFEGTGKMCQMLEWWILPSYIDGGNCKRYYSWKSQ
jgi:hypothetical protein